MSTPVYFSYQGPNIAAVADAAVPFGGGLSGFGGGLSGEKNKVPIASSFFKKPDTASVLLKVSLGL